MLAYRPGFPVAYDPGLTALSVIIAVIKQCGLGFWLSLTKAGPVIGGAVIGAAISAMHYVGMAAVRVPADADLGLALCRRFGGDRHCCHGWRYVKHW